MVGIADADAVALLTRAPASGGKTRLFAALGRPIDPSLLAALFLDTLDAVQQCDAVPVIAVTPADACGEVQALAPDVGVMPQPDGNLGDRMAGVMRALFGAGARRVALVGSDLPALRASHLKTAFDALGHEPRRLVLGPSVDGGYYLIAACAPPPVFAGIEWGSELVLRATCEAALHAGWHVRPTETLWDVDTPADLRRAASLAPSSRTAQWVSTNLGSAYR